jgi:hypothetical protein
MEPPRSPDSREGGGRHARQQVGQLTRTTPGAAPGLAPEGGAHPGPMPPRFGPLDVHCALCGAPPGQRCTWLHRDRSAPTTRERRHVHHTRRARAATENDRAHRKAQP